MLDYAMTGVQIVLRIGLPIIFIAHVMFTLAMLGGLLPMYDIYCGLPSWLAFPAISVATLFAAVDVWKIPLGGR